MDPLTRRDVSNRNFSWRDLRLSNEVSSKIPCQHKQGTTGKPFVLAMRCDCLPWGSEQMASLKHLLLGSVCTQRSS